MNAAEQTPPREKRPSPPQLEAYRWKPGEPREYRGRPKGLRRLVREVVGPNGEECIQTLAAVMRGELTGESLRRTAAGEFEAVTALPTVRERVDAAELLLAYGFGKPTQTVDVQGLEGMQITPGPVPLALETVSDAELAQLESLLQKALPPAPLPGEVVDGEVVAEGAPDV